MPGVVLDPLESSIAEQAGIQRGDILLSINDSILENPEDIVSILQNNAD